MRGHSACRITTPSRRPRGRVLYCNWQPASLATCWYIPDCLQSRLVSALERRSWFTVLLWRSVTTEDCPNQRPLAGFRTAVPTRATPYDADMSMCIATVSRQEVSHRATALCDDAPGIRRRSRRPGFRSPVQMSFRGASVSWPVVGLHVAPADL